MPENKSEYDLNPHTRLRVHASHIKSFLMCPAQFYFKFVKRVKAPASSAAILGRSLHKAAEINLRQKEQTFRDLPEPDIIGQFEQAWDESSKEPIHFDEDEKPGEVKDMGVSCTRSLARIIMPTIQPEPGTVEMPLEAPVINRGFDVAGRLDVIDQRKFVRDFKTTGAYPGKDKLTGKYRPTAGDIVQVTQYSLMAKAAKREIAGTELSYIHKKIAKGEIIPKVYPAEFQPTTDHESAFLRIADKLVDAVNREAYVPNPTCFVCSPEKCGYWHLCRGGAIF